MPIIVDTVRRVFIREETAYLEIGPWPDSPDTLHLHTADAASKDWFGELSVIMSSEFAIALGNALINAAKEMETTK